MRAPPHPLGVDQHQQAVVGHQVEHGHHALDQRRRQRLHALDRDALRQLVEHVRGTGQLRDQLERPRAHGVRQQDLAARRRPHAVVGHLEAALVRDGEPADLLDVLAPQLDAQRVVLGRREHVDDPAAHGELAALLHHVDARVRGGDQPLGEVREVDPVPRADRDRLQLAQPVDHRLQQRAHRQHEHADRAGVPLGLRVREPPEHGEPAGHGVAAGREPLVRQRLPRRQHRDVVVRQVAAHGGGQLVGVAARRGHDDERAAAASAASSGGRTPAGPTTSSSPAGADGLDRRGGGGVGEEGGQEAGEVHGVPWVEGVRTTRAAPDPWDPGCICQSTSPRPTRDR